MPSRWASWTIIVFWLVMMAWLTGAELYHRFGTRPRLQDTLAASAQVGPVHWNITEILKRDRPLREGEAPEERPLGTAVTEVQLDARSGKYHLIQQIHLVRLFNTGFSLNLTSRSEVNLFGRLQEIRFKAAIPEVNLHCDLIGRPQGPDKLRIQAFFRIASENHEVEQTISYDGTDLVLSSLCPLDRMPGLKPGQTWKTPIVDPVESILGQSFSSGNLTTAEISRPAVTVRVWDQPQGLLWRGEYVPCLVVEAVQGGRSMKIYVRESDGLVLRQTAELGSLSPLTLAVTRDPRKSSSVSPLAE